MSFTLIMLISQYIKREKERREESFILPILTFV